tara:strand:+ start:654 stop:1244 length:591 start_codon:yes stop_codon:yes gene_type:complete
MNRKEKLKRIFTLANLLSFSRIFMAIPLVMALDKGWFDESIRMMVCAGIILAIFLSDVLDGALARWMDQVSNVGKVIDPIADKICMMVVLIYLINTYGDIFFIFFLLITSRDTILIIIGIYLLQYQEEVFQSLQSGKIFMFFSSAMMVSYIFSSIIPENIRIGLYVLSITFFIVSSYFYIQNYRESFKRIRNVRNT